MYYEFRKEIYFWGRGLTSFCKTAGVLPVVSSGQQLKEAETFPPRHYAKRGRGIDLAFWRAPEWLFDEPDEFLIWSRAALCGALPRSGQAEGEDETAAEVNGRLSWPAGSPALRHP